MFELSILSGLLAFVFIGLLCQPYEVFGWWPPLVRLAIFGSTGIRDYDVYRWWQLALYRPLADCPKCCAGWVSLAVWLWKYETFIFPDTLFFVAGAIFTAWLLTAGKERLGLNN